MSRLQNLADLMEFRDESGRLLGYFHPAISADSSREVTPRRSPFSDEDLKERQKQRAGVSLSELLSRLPS